MAAGAGKSSSPVLCLVMRWQIARLPTDRNQKSPIPYSMALLFHILWQSYGFEIILVLVIVA